MGGARLWTELLVGIRFEPGNGVLCGAVPTASAASTASATAAAALAAAAAAFAAALAALTAPTAPAATLATLAAAATRLALRDQLEPTPCGTQR